MGAYLRPLSGGNVIRLDDPLVVLGRSRGCELQIADSSVSRVHCVLAKVGNEWVLRDLESRNGVKLNGKQVERAVVRSNDTISVAKLDYRFMDNGGAGPPSTSDPAERAERSTAMAESEVDTGEWRQGHEIFAGCRLNRQIGAGGFGEVWSADSDKLGPIAVKRVPFDEPMEKEARALQLMKGLRHRHITRVYNARVIRGMLVIVMELGDKTASARLRECQRQNQPGIPGAELLEYIGHIAEALDYMYFTRKALHRDIKPSNILLFGQEAKLCDFGLVKLMEGSIALHSGFASYQFAPPEFFNAQMVPGSDQYSLAATYTYLLTGEHVVQGAEFKQLLEQHVAGRIHLARVPESQKPVLRRALSKNPADRYQTCVEFAYELQTAAGEAPG